MRERRQHTTDQSGPHVLGTHDGCCAPDEKDSSSKLEGLAAMLHEDRHKTEASEVSDNDWVGPDGEGLYVTCVDPEDENYRKFLYASCEMCGHPKPVWTHMIDTATCWFWRDSAIESLPTGYTEGKNVLVLTEKQVETMFPEEDT